MDETRRPAVRVRLQACHECDLLVDLRHFVSRGRAECPRCGAVLAHSKKDSLNRTLALSLTGLLLYLPAVMLPVMSFKLLGQTHSNTLINAALKLAGDGYLWMAFMVAFCSLLVPLFILLILFSCCLLTRIRALPELQIFLLRSHFYLKHWGMLDVYMLGLLVAIVKMKDLGDLQMGPGLVAFSALLLLLLLAQLQFDSRECWERLENQSL
ncbi:MAG: paraquat-inducible protein A [Motiliproteus sp.]|jgi:paraquat-inducible protein A